MSIEACSRIPLKKRAGEVMGDGAQPFRSEARKAFS